MQNDSRIGCFGFILACLILTLIWKAILYIGIPLALIGGGIAFYILNNYPNDKENRSKRAAALYIALASAGIGSLSLAGNIFTDGPFGRPEKKPQTFSNLRKMKNSRLRLSVTMR